MTVEGSRSWTYAGIDVTLRVDATNDITMAGLSTNCVGVSSVTTRPCSRCTSDQWSKSTRTVT
jgi:hypothetical protein